jgi:hypothetical protein
LKTKLLLSLLCLAVVLICASCESTPPARNIPNPTLPQTTPFDQNPMARQAYLEAYRDGYRAAARGEDTSTDRIREPFRFAKELGWRAGVTDAHKAASEPGK